MTMPRSRASAMVVDPAHAGADRDRHPLAVDLRGLQAHAHAQPVGQRRQVAAGTLP